MDIKQIKSISFPEIKKFLEDYVKNMPNYDNKWKDFYESSAGVTIIEVAAGVCSFLSFTSYMNRKDSLLDYSSMPSTIVSIANTLGYSVNRKSCARLKIEFISEEDLFWRRENPIGNWMGRDLSLLKDQFIKVGVNTVEVAIGTWEEFSTNLKEVTDFYSLLIERPIDNNFYEAYLGGELIKVVKSSDKLDKDSVFIRSTINGVYIIFGNGIYGKSYSYDQKFQLKYIKSGDLLETHFIESDKVQLNLKYKMENIKVIDTGSPEDDPAKLVALSPGYHSARGTIIQFTDIATVAAGFEGLVSASGLPRRDSCCSIDVWYLRKDQQKFTDDQREDFRQYMVDRSLLGIDFFIYDPVPIDVSIKVKIVTRDSYDQQSIESALKSEIDKMTMRLGGIFSVGNILSLNHPDVVALYIDFPIRDKLAESSQYFRLKKLDFQFIPEKHRSDMRFGTDESAGYELTI